MIKKILFIFFLLSIFIFAKKKNFIVEVSSKKININDLITLSVSLENIDSEDVVIVTKGFNNLGRFSYQTQFFIVNGNSIRKKILKYKLQPLQLGKGTISVSLGDFKKGPFEIEISQGSGRPSTPQKPSSLSQAPTPQSLLNRFFKNNSSSRLVRNVFFKNLVNKKKLFINEIGILETFLYYQVFPKNIILKNKFTHSGLNLVPVEHVTTSFPEEKIRGQLYKKILIAKYFFYPYKLGRLKIKDGVYLVENVDIFSGLQGFSRKVSPINIEVIEYTNRPEGFNNQWGDFSITFSLSKSQIEVNNPLKLLILISGEGNFKAIPAFDFSYFPHELSIRRGSIKDDFKLEGHKIKGNKKMEYYILPKSQGNYDLPYLEFTSYSPTKKKYVKIKKKIPTLRVFPDTSNPNNLDLERGKNKEENINEEIQYIKTELAYKKIWDNFIFQHFVIVAFFLGFLLVNKRKKISRIWRNQIHQEMIDALNKLLLSKESEVFPKLNILLNQYLKELSQGEFKSMKDLKEQLKKKDWANQEAIRFLISKVTQYEKIIYAPQANEKEVNPLEEINEIISTLKAEENSLK